MPRASKMKALPKDGDHVFYWPDIGPVECRIKNNEIVEALMVETIGEDPESWAAA